MPPRLPRISIGWSGYPNLPIGHPNQQICPLCSTSRRPRPPNETKRSRLQQLGQNRIRARQQSTVSSASAADNRSLKSSKALRSDLRDALTDLQKYAASYVNISRLQLAIRGLEQTPGDETIRIAILGLADGGASVRTAKELLRLLLADPLNAEEEWERILVDEQPESKPLLLRVGYNGVDDSIHSSRLIQELNVSSPVLNGHKLEILILEMDPPSREGSTFAEAVLVPTMEIPTSNTGRYTPVTSPVHRSLVVSKGLMGAATLLNYPIDTDRDVVRTAVNLKIDPSDTGSALPCQVVNIPLATEALQAFRESVDNALLYERSWFASGIPGILDWVKLGTASRDEMKAPLRKLIESLLRHTTMAIEAAQARQLDAALLNRVSSADLTGLRRGLSQWAEQAHTELRDQLDIALNGHRWRKLGWWKLFWRVDDVSMIACDILSHHFLTNAEQEVIFLAGRIVEAGILIDTPEASHKDWAYKTVQEKQEEPKLGSNPPPPQIQDLIEAPKDHLPIKLKSQPWPLHIPATRAYLSQETVPALQALAQKLVLQTLSTTSFASLLGGLMYVTSVSTSLYEAGAVAAVGIVWSLRRMQTRWETARKFWEGEVREEGRKAVRGVEGVVGDVLGEPSKPLEVDVEVVKAKEAVQRAQNALRESR